MKFILIGSLVTVTIALLVFALLRGRHLQRIVRRARQAGGRRPETIPIHAGQTMAEEGERQDER